MKKFKLLASSLILSSLVLSGCALLPTPKKKSSSEASNTSGTSVVPGSSDSSSSSSSSSGGGGGGGGGSYTPITAWPATAQTEMMEYFGELLPLAPLEASTIYSGYDDDEGCYYIGDDYGKANLTTYGNKLVLAGFVQGTDDDGYTVYTKTATNGVVMNLYYDFFAATSTTAAGNEIDVYFSAAKERTTDTAWSEADAELMEYVLDEALPFIQFGEDYIVNDYDDFTIQIYDEFTEDLTQEYKTELVKAANGFTYDGAEDGALYFSKSHNDGTSISLMTYFDSENGYGNVVVAQFNPVTTATTDWPSFTELTEAQTYSGYTIPQFASTSGYKYYIRHGIIYIDGVTTTNLSETYATSLGTAGLVVAADTYYGDAFDWYEKLSLEYYCYGSQDQTTSAVTITGFGISFSTTTPSSTFVADWPSTAINTYLEEISVEATVPSLTNASGKQVKYYEMDEEAAMAYVVQMMGEYAVLFDEDTIREYAQDYIGFYVEMYDADNSLVASYNSKFDTSKWTVKENTNSSNEVVSYTWTENETGLPVNVSSSGYSLVVFISEPGSTPVPPSGDSASIIFKTASADATSEPSNILDTISEGANYFKSATGSKIYAGKSGLKFGSSKAAGNVTFTVDSTALTSAVTTIEIATATFMTGASGTEEENGSLTMYVNGDDSNSITVEHGKTGSLTVNDEVESITFVSTKRIYLVSIVLNF